jgi:hypothetical protein
MVRGKRRPLTRHVSTPKHKSSLFSALHRFDPIQSTLPCGNILFTFIYIFHARKFDSSDPALREPKKFERKKFFPTDGRVP